MSKVKKHAPSKSYGSNDQRRQSCLKSGGRRSESKQFRFPSKFPRNFDFFQAISQEISIFQGKFPTNFDFFRQFHKKFRFSRQKFLNDLFFLLSRQNWPFTATSGQIIIFLLKSHHFRTYFLYTLIL